MRATRNTIDINNEGQWLLSNSKMDEFIYWLDKNAQRRRGNNIPMVIRKCTFCGKEVGDDGRRFIDKKGKQTIACEQFLCYEALRRKVLDSYENK